MNIYNDIVKFIRSIYQTDDFIPLHVPVFKGNEKQYLIKCIDTTFVSYVGEFVSKFEEETAKYTGAKYAIAVSNGTVALQMALLVVGVKPNNEVITQPLTFVATVNAIKHVGAIPVFVDVDNDTMGLSPEKLESWILANTKYDSKNKYLINKKTGRHVSAIVPVHTFGHPCHIDEIAIIAKKYNLMLVEDSAESLGSLYKGIHTGCYGDIGILSYNGNKTITTGGGGMIITNNERFAKLAKHLTTTAKVQHPWEYVHDMVGYNLRLPNINAAVGCAQMENLDSYLVSKRDTASKYNDFFSQSFDIKFMKEPQNAISNYWLNTIKLPSLIERDKFLTFCNDNKIMCRPAWRLMSKLNMYKDAQCGDLTNSEFLADRLVNLPSSVR